MKYSFKYYFLADRKDTEIYLKTYITYFLKDIIIKCNRYFLINWFYFVIIIDESI